MRAVLLQIRDDGPAEAQERLCFLEACGLRPAELECINLAREPDVAWRRIAGADAFLVGGAGAHSVTKSYEFTPSLEALVGQAIAERMPFFGSCYGHHVLVTVLGGAVATDHHSGEVGTFEIELTDAGRRDPLLEGFPACFAAQLGHHDRVETLPAGLVELAFSSRCRYQMIRVAGRPAYSTQFHCEMSQQHLLARLEMYRDTYLAERTARDEVSDALRPSAWADWLLRRFLELHT